MDGIDGRGEVVVIDATHRTDAVYPALRRPGRRDRGIYFGQLTVNAREKILSIMTRKWASWGESGGEEVKERLPRGSSTMNPRITMVN
jgi:SpoVK/Ycf46/Vps4 family AAA+-type ATPase